MTKYMTVTKCYTNLWISSIITEVSYNLSISTHKNNPKTKDAIKRRDRTSKMVQLVRCLLPNLTT